MPRAVGSVAYGVGRGLALSIALNVLGLTQASRSPHLMAWK